MSLTTKLEAVNEILSALGQSLVNSLSTNSESVREAEDILTKVSRDVQTKGWVFNTQIKEPLNRDANNNIYVSNTALRVDINPAKYPDIIVTQRGNQLYDMKNRRDTFTQDLEGDVVYMLDFEQLPEEARRYIMIRAALTARARELDQDNPPSFSAFDEQRAWASLQSHQIQRHNYNIFKNSHSQRFIRPFRNLDRWD